MNLFINKDWSTLKKLTMVKVMLSNVEYTENTATGNPATFTTNTNRALTGLTIPFTPMQTGEGDPSPENIRPISGTDHVNVFHSGGDTSDPTTYNIVFPDEVGTAYGGTYDYTTGVLTVTMVKQQITWSEYRTNRVFTNNEIRDFKPRATPLHNGEMGNNCCDVAPWLYKYTDDSIHFYTSGSAIYVCLPIDTESDVKINVCYDVEPTTFQLTPQEIKTLIGSNVLWSDTNGTNTVKYLTKGWK